MKVILKQDIKGIGRKYEVKDVADGYANNFLIPKRLAEYASPEAVKKAEILKAKNIVEMEIRESLSRQQIETLKGVKVIIRKKTNEKGHLFEHVHQNEISEALKEQAKIEIEPGLIVIPEPIKGMGEYPVFAEIGKNRGEFKVVVESDEKPLK